MRCNPIKRDRHRGVGLIELLIALAISAALLTAVGVATDASFKAYAVNEEQASLTQRARLTLDRLVTYIRTSREHGPVTPAQDAAFGNGATVADTGIAMLDESGDVLTFAHDPATKQLRLTTGGTTRVLLRGVVAFQVKLEPMQSSAAIRAGGGFDLLRRASITLALQTSGQSADINEGEDKQVVTLSTSVMPRRNSW